MFPINRWQRHHTHSIADADADADAAGVGVTPCEGVDDAYATLPVVAGLDVAAPVPAAAAVLATAVASADDSRPGGTDRFSSRRRSV